MNPLNEVTRLLIRKLRVEWSPTESRAPEVAGIGSASWRKEEIVQEVVSILAAPTLTEAEAIERYREAIFGAETLLDAGTLRPGRYAYKTLGHETICVEVNDKHLALLRAANVRVFDQGDAMLTVAIDPKRPYGQRIAYQFDMAEILGLESKSLSPDQLERLTELHAMMAPVMQVFLQHAQIGA